MKLKIKVKVFDQGTLPNIIKKGDWIDLTSRETIELNGPQAKMLHKNKKGEIVERRRDVSFEEITYIKLGVAMELPKGFEAIVVSRSSTPRRHGIVCANSMAVIDQSYCGDGDEWCFVALALRHTVIDNNSRIAQFRIQLSQKATFWQKLKWFLTSSIELVMVDSLNNSNRNGLGSTGV